MTTVNPLVPDNPFKSTVTSAVESVDNIIATVASNGTGISVLSPNGVMGVAPPTVLPGLSTAAGNDLLSSAIPDKK